MRLLIVSNRLPTVIKEKDGKYTFSESAGGLVSGLSAYLDSLKNTSFTKAKYIWVGWPGLDVVRKSKNQIKLKLLKGYNAYPVFLSEKIMDKFYLGFCNKTIWPLFHYLPSFAVYAEEYWEYYKLVNQSFCHAILELIKPDDIVWIHDYHLMLLPKLLREKKPNIPIGFFLHIPFPSYEIFRLLPRDWDPQIIRGLLGADLIGFHTHEYTQYFLRSVLRMLGYEHNIGQIVVDNRIVKADTFPMGIDFQRYYDTVSDPDVEKESSRLKKRLLRFKVILSVDRLDYTKGIANRLKGYELFLEKNEKWHGKVVLVIVVVPSRIGVEHYQQMKRQIDELVGEINGRFGNINWTPVLYQYKFLSLKPLVALYCISDVALVTPLRDGMNLIAKEYLASRVNKTGVLILSETAGAASELGEAVIINANNTEEIAEALKTGLEMPKEEQVRRNQIMQTRLRRYNVIKWANEFINELLLIKKESKKLETKLISKSIMQNIQNAKRRLIFLDYDGTLVPFASTPDLAKPSKEVLNIIKELSENDRNEIVLISGRDRHTINNWFGSFNINLVAEHGVWIKDRNDGWKLIQPLKSEWKGRIRPILERYVDRLPGSFVEEKEFSLAWHYRNTDLELASVRTKELIDDLVNLTSRIDVSILQGNKVIEIRNAGINKGTACLRWVSKTDYNTIIAIGDDLTDEDLFKSLPENSYTIRVGLTPSFANYYLRSHLEVIKFLENLI
jgi:trehalose 6-phosphate synthase/phosphatase